MQTFTSDAMGLARRYWGMERARGVIAIVFGLLAIFVPHLTFALFIWLFGAFAIVEGLILCANALSQSKAATTASETGTYQQTSGARAYQPTSGTGTTYRAGEAGTYQRAGEAGTAYQGIGPESGLYRRSRTGWKTLLVEGVLSIICGLLAFILPFFVGRLVLYAVAAWAVFKGIGFLMQTQKRGWVMGVIGVLAIVLALILFFNPLSIVRTFLWIVGVFSLAMGVLLLLRSFQAGTATTHETRRPIEPTY